MEGVNGEFELIAAIRERIAQAGAPQASSAVVLGSGDDAAITARPGATATSVDALIEGVHFRIPPFSARQVGHKALAVALSDLAAMGATAGEAYVQLGIPEDRTEAELLELADGLAQVAAAHAVVIAGGDVTRAPSLLVAVTVVGAGTDPEALVRRAGACPGISSCSRVSSEARRRGSCCSSARSSRTGSQIRSPRRCALASWSRRRCSPPGRRWRLPGRRR